MQEKLREEHDIYILYRDADTDRTVAEELRKRLQRFRLPGRLRKDLSDESRRIGRIYMDREGSFPDFESGLQDAEWMVLVCTPRLPGLPRISELIERYKKLHGHEHILALLAEGEPEDSFPESIRFREETGTDENGNPTVVQREVEPLAAEVREDNAGKRRKLLDDAVMRMAAPMFGLNYDDLRQRHRERRMKRLAALLGGAAALFLMVGVTSLLLSRRISSQNALIETQTAELQEQYAETRRKYAEFMAHVSGELLSRGRRLDAIYAVRNVLPDTRTSSDPLKPYLSSAVLALTNALAVYETNGFIPESIIPLPDEQSLKELSRPADYESLGEDILLFPYNMGIRDPENRIRLPFSISNYSGEFDPNTLASYVSGGVIAGVSPTANGFLLAAKDGSLYQFLPRESILEDYGLSLYRYPPADPVDSAFLRDEEQSLFLKFHGSDQLVRYRWKTRPDFPPASREDYSFPERDSALLLHDPGDTSVSDDGRFRLVLNDSWNLEIYEASENSPVNTIYGSYFAVLPLRKLPDTEYYLVELLEDRAALLLDDSAGVVGKFSSYYGYDAENRCFLFNNLADQWESELSLVPLLSYEELIAEADRLLGNYEPPEEIRRQYGI